jgi:hypothetical protein
MAEGRAVTFQELLDEFIEDARNKTEKGALFERLAAKYLKTGPQ